jgi:secreted PhoX family phosphatase
MWQLPRIGLFQWENTIPAPNRSDTTLVMGQEDAAEGQIWLYRGTKTRTGSPVDKAGLTNGANFVAAVAGATNDVQFRADFGKNNARRFTLSEVGWDQEGAPQNAEAKAEGITLNRIEDGHWDPRNPRDFYFLTTEGGKGADVPTGFYGRDGGGLWRMRFDDIERPELGGTLTLLLDGSEAPFLNKPDNMTIDTKGNLLIQEDPGNNVSVARIVAYRISDGARGVVAQFDPALFGWQGAKLPNGNPVLGPGQITFDEESSGIIDAKEVIGSGWFLLDAQVHKASPDPELVEEGQMLALRVSGWDDVYGDDEDDDD